MPASVSFVIPCLNEAESLPAVLDAIDAVRRGPFAGRDVEVVVADNGSDDGSREVAAARGARVVACPVRGYGAALQHGFAQARNDIVVFADADDTYDFGEAPALVARLEEGYDLVLGSRIRGAIAPGAMPFLHRWVGTPVLTAVLNALYAGRDGGISDCNSGFRCFRRTSFAGWAARASGMEFASEMLVRAMKSGARIGEVPISLRPDTRDRTPHLKRWRDGTRHLLQILSESPTFFFRSGLLVLLANWVVLLVGLFFGPVALPGFNAFGIHTMMFALLGTLLGLNVFGIGMLLAARRPQDRGPYGALLEIDEGRLLWGGAGVLLLSILASLVPMVWSWWAADFRFLALQKQTLVLVAFTANGVFFLFNVVAAHLLKDR
ncbi:MAG: glycosyltransferase family 2 protein [Acidobacteriota bacterium]|jgi:glycosyltransferase involved in cell wall biosynthesis